MNIINIKFEIDYSPPIGTAIRFNERILKRSFVNVDYVYMFRHDMLPTYHNFLKRYSKRFNKKLTMSLGDGTYKEWNPDDNN